MPVIELATAVAAPVERVFDLARSIELHVVSVAHTGERAVAGVTSGSIGIGEQVTWRDRFDFNSPLGPLGALADWLVLTRYLRALLIERNQAIREAAEGTRWKDYLP